MDFYDALAAAAQSLRGNRLRSFLTVLGVVIGVSIVILLVSMGKSAQGFVSDQVRSIGFGPNVMVIHPGKMDPPIGASRLTYDDALEIHRRVPQAVDVMPVVVGAVKTQYRTNSYLTNLWGVTDNYTKLVAYHVAEGTFFSATDVHHHRKICVLGDTVSHKLFGGLSPIGESVRVHGTKFTVVGVMEHKGEMLGFDIDDTLFAPVTTVSDLLDTTRLLEIICWLRSPEDAPQAQGEITEVLQSRHKRSDDFHFHTQGEVMSILGTVTSALTTFVAAIAAISLVVGSIGIMNIMLVSVTERTREIGLRKAIGARRRDIFVQFLMEALLISFVGGGIGIVLGVGLSVTILLLIHLPVTVTLWAVFAAGGASALVGLVSGVYPAMRAAALDPVVALRSS
jgi:putative ABC transport system permease protein